ncbi:MAG: tyrosine-type recombinase/integrase [Lacrimispora sp.]
MDDIVEEIRKDGIDSKHITPHTFRHTFATRNIENDITPKVLQTILGHNDLVTTMATYVHVLKDTKVNEMQKLAHLFS